jgi:hypothetical protein
LKNHSYSSNFTHLSLAKRHKKNINKQEIHIQAFLGTGQQLNKVISGMPGQLLTKRSFNLQ